MLRYNRANRLYHSDTYLGQEYSNELYHWKYIKREKKNGRWVYYYKDDQYEKLKSDHTKAVNKLNAYDKSKSYNVVAGVNAKGSTYSMRKSIVDNKKNSDKTRQKLARNVASTNLEKDHYEQFKKDTVGKDILRLTAKALDSVSKNKHKIKKNIKKSINKGKKAISKLFNKQSKAKAKSSVPVKAKASVPVKAKASAPTKKKKK